MTTDNDCLRDRLDDANDAAAETRALLRQAIELLQQVVGARDDAEVHDRITVWLLARRDDGTLREIERDR